MHCCNMHRSLVLQDIVHGDLCAGNILLCSASNERGFIAKVADFGLGRDKLAEPVNTHTYGTVTHMPPELLIQGDLSKACDTYAFGALLWEMFCGERPWPNMLPMQVNY
jgi:serine/threonine protein kinase